MTAVCLNPAGAAISVGPSGSAILDFAARPPAADWSTKTITGADVILGNEAAVINAVQTNVTAASTTTQVLDGSPTVPPAQNALASWSSGGASTLWTRPTGNGATVLMATLTNESGSSATSLQIIYTLAESAATPTEQSAAHQVLYSLTGASNSWVSIGALSGGAAGARSNTFNLASTWAPNTVMYVLWADDNATGGTDRGYSIDDVSFKAGNAAIPVSVTLTAPANGAVMFAPTNVTLSASTSGTVPATSVSFYTNGVLAATDASTPFSAVLANLPVGSYAIHAQAVNGVDPTAFSTTNTILVRNEFISFTGADLSENFDSMGVTGTLTPTGWYVGGALPATTVTVTPGDGSVGANAGILGWNYGINGTNPDTDRALGTSPTGADRNIEARIRNNTANNITAFEIGFDGEVWRNYTNVFGVLTNYVSYDLGTTWIATTYDFSQPFAPAQPDAAVDGNAPGNRTSGIGGPITPSTPVPPGGVIYIRWQDPNDAGLDGGLAIDNFTFSATLDVFSPFVLITAPTNNATFAAAAPITINAIGGMFNPITNVAFFRDGGTLIGNDATAPFSAIYSNSVAGVHTLTAVAKDSTGASVSTTNIITITINPNVPPSVTLTNPAPGSTYFVGTMVTNVSASATDPDGSIVRVEFLLDGVLFATDTTSPYGFDLCDITAGAHTIAGVAVDNAGGRATNTLSISATNPPGISVIVSNGAAWKYLDDGTDQGTAWHAQVFNDSGWSNGVAELGYGDAPGRPERTTVGFGLDANNKHPTTYFRKTFNVASPGSFAGLTLNVLADDHFIVYLNGVEVFRDMTNAVVTYLTVGGGAVAHDGVDYVSTNLPTSALVAGANIVAVEVHQDTVASSDISFDLMLWGSASAGPKLTIMPASATQVTISWGADATGYTLQGNSTDVANTGAWSNIGVAILGAGSTTVTTSPAIKFFRLKKP